jgi:hypothetical protein
MQNATDATTERRGGRYPLVVAPALFERAKADPRYTDACGRGDIVPLIRGERNMGRFRKRPLEVEAVRFVEVTPEAVISWGDVVPAWLQDGLDKSPLQDGAVFVLDYGSECRVLVRTLEGPLQVTPGDWVIKGTAGELYPCKPEIFAAIYEPADG